MESINHEALLCRKLEPVHQVERYIKVVSPFKPVIHNVFPRPVYKHPVSVYVPSCKRAQLIRKANTKAMEKETIGPISQHEKLPKVVEEIKIICEIILIPFDIKMEMEIVISEKLLAIKDFALQSLKNSLNKNNCDLELNESDIAIYYQKSFNLVDLGISITEAIKDPTASKSLIGNMLYIDAKIVNFDKKFQMIKKIQIFSKPIDPREKLRLLVGLEKPNKKIGLRVIVVSENGSEEKNMSISMKKINWKNILEFPLSAVLFVERVEIPKEPQFQNFQYHLLVKVSFVADLQWEDMYLLFDQHDDFLKFLFFVIESSSFKRENTPKKSTTMDYSRIQKRRIDVNRKDFQKGSLSLDDFVKQNKDLEFLKDALHAKRIDSLPTDLQKEEFTPEERVFLEKGFKVRQTGIFGGKSEKEISFSLEQMELQFFKRPNKKFLCSFMIRDINNLQMHEKKNEKLIVCFKNPKKFKPIILKFDSENDREIFIKIFNRMTSIKLGHKVSSEEKDFLKSSRKRYSWLLQPLNPIAALKKINSEHSFYVIVENGSPPKQILVLSLAHNIMTFFRSDESIIKQYRLDEILNLESDFRDNRKLTINMEKKKSIDIIFSSVKSKITFESSIYNVKYPDYVHNQVICGNETPKRTFSIYAITWNCGFSDPPNDISENDENLFHKFETYDLLVLGLQEVKANSWIEKFRTSFKETHTLLNVVVMWRMMICIFIRREYYQLVTNIEVAEKPTGLGKIIGNKGGVMITFKIFDNSFCFYNCHLAAKPGRENIRKNEYIELIKTLRGGIKELETIFQYDYVFWLGDMNFRVDHPFAKVIELINNDKLENLKDFCQLIKLRNNNQLFSDFCEKDINFKPTYRKMRESSGFSNKKNQSPSWCDRIFFRALPNKKIDIEKYDSKDMHYGSDHRPVLAIFHVDIDLPYIPINHFLSRDRVSEGLFKLEDIQIEFNYSSLQDYNDLHMISFPFEISLTFYSTSLNNHPSTFPILVQDVNTPLVWDSDSIPLLYTAISDTPYLANKNVFIIMTANSDTYTDVVIGQVSLALRDVIEENGEKIRFEEKIKLFGRIFGTITGEIEFSVID